MSEEPDYDVKKLEKLLDQMADGDLSDEQIDELQEILLSSEQARAKYINFNYMDDSLHWNYAEAALDNKRDNEFYRETVEETKTKSPVQFVWLAAAAAIAVVFTLFFTMQKSESGQSEFVASISHAENAQWSGNVQKNLNSGTLKLLEGSAKVTFKSGAEMTLTAPAEVDLISKLHARLIRGKVKLFAPQTAMGFRLETEASNFVDIGTEFEVSVDENNNSDIHVLDGVVVARSNYSDAIVPFGKNEAGRIDSLYGRITPVYKNERTNPLLAAKGENKPVLDKNSRVIFIGERTTDYETYLHMVNQAIYDFAPENAPTLLNAGLTFKLGGDDQNYEEFVKRMNPTHAVISVASIRPSYNIDHNPLWFETVLKRLCDKLDADGIKPVIHVGFPVSDKEPVMSHFNTYKQILLEVAEERAYLLARADHIWSKYREIGKHDTLSQVKGTRFTYGGHQVFARSILDGFGYKALEVPQRLRLKPLPGIIQNWKWTEYEVPEKLTPEVIADLKTSGWKDIKLPLSTEKGHTAKFINPYMQHEHQAKELGLALEMSGVYENTIRAFTEFEANGEEKYLNIGGGIKEIWLNGELIKGGLTNMFKDGRHPGGRRYLVKLKKGTNKIVLDCTMNFFVSLTDDNQWGLQPPAAK